MTPEERNQVINTINHQLATSNAIPAALAPEEPETVVTAPSKAAEIKSEIHKLRKNAEPTVNNGIRRTF